MGKFTEFKATTQIMVVDIGSLYELEASSDHYREVAHIKMSELDVPRRSVRLTMVP